MSVLLRSIWNGRVRWAFPHTLVEASRDGVVLYVAPGTPGKIVRRDEDGRYLERWVRSDEPDDHIWWGHGVLRVLHFGRAHSIDLFWDGDERRFSGWYVNLQEPLRETRLGFDTTDHALDLWVSAGGSWCWKDEDDFAEAQALGVFTPEEARAVRAEGERVLAQWPFPTGWEEWQPDPTWPVPKLPVDWHLL